MGLVRVLLAICVLDFHSVYVGGNKSLFPFGPPNGLVAVQAFYVISGFYMSLVLTERYAKCSLWVFYRARLLRLLPLYWIAVAATFVFMLVTNYPNVWVIIEVARAHLWLGLWIAFSNLALIGQDWNAFIPYETAGLSQFNLVYTAWTISVELTFYLFAPWLVLWHNRWLVALLSASIIGRLIAYRLGFDYDPWNYRFFGFELAWFVAGILAHRFFVDGNERWPRPMKLLGVAALLLIVASIFVYPLIWDQRPLSLLPTWLIGGGAAVALIMPFALPFVFAVTKDSKLDNLIGEFSYPIYITHAFVIMVLVWSLPSLNSGRAVVLGTLLISAILLVALRPIERVRAAPRQNGLD